MLSLEPSENRVRAISCGLETTCDSGILGDCSERKYNCKTYGTAGYCIQPSEDTNVACADHCDCLGTYSYYYGFLMGCRNEYKFDMKGNRYINTRIVKYYSETYGIHGQYNFGAQYEHFRTLDSFRDGKSNENTNGSCPENCAEYVDKFCPQEIVQSNLNCKFYCHSVFPGGS